MKYIYHSYMRNELLDLSAWRRREVNLGKKMYKINERLSLSPRQVPIVDLSKVPGPTTSNGKNGNGHNKENPLKTIPIYQTEKVVIEP